MGPPTQTVASGDAEMPDLVLDRTSYVPFYRQLRDQLETQIKAGRLKLGQAIASEGACADRLGLSKMTVRQAFQSLRNEGLLIIEKGKRPIVGAGRAQKDFQKLRGFTEEMLRRGLKPSSKVLHIDEVVPEPTIATLLHLWRQDKVYRLRRLRFANNEIVGLETILLPTRLFPDLHHLDLEKQSLYSIMESHYQVHVEWSEEELEAVPAEKESAKLLQVTPGFPLFSMRRTVYGKDDTPIEHGHSLFRGDRYNARITSRREH